SLTVHLSMNPLFAAEREYSWLETALHIQCVLSYFFYFLFPVIIDLPNLRGRPHSRRATEKNRHFRRVFPGRIPCRVGQEKRSRFPPRPPAPPVPDARNAWSCGDR